MRFNKLQWSEQIAQALNKATKAINVTSFSNISYCIRLIKKYFTKLELLQLITANVFSVLYYNFEIWHIPSLKTELKKKLTSISAKAIKTCMYYPDNMISFENIHRMNNRAMPDSIMSYKTAIQLHKLYNTMTQSIDWISLK